MKNTHNLYKDAHLSADPMPAVFDLTCPVCARLHKIYQDETAEVCKCGHIFEKDQTPPERQNAAMTNEKRADIAGIALKELGSEGDAVRDLLANLMHWCVKNGYDFETELEAAHCHFEVETVRPLNVVE